MKKLVTLLVLLALVCGAAFGQVQIFQKINLSSDEANLINPEFEIYPNTVGQGDYSLAGKTLSYFFYEEGKTAADFQGDVWYFDLGDGTNVSNWGYANVYFYDLAEPVVSGDKKANIACVVNFTGGVIPQNLYASLEIAIWYKWDYNGYSFTEFDDWSYAEMPVTARDFFSLNQYVVFWDNYASKAYFGYYPQNAAYDNIVYVNYGLTSGANNGTSWANAFRGDKALQRAIDAAKLQASPSDYMQIWVVKSSESQPILEDSIVLRDAPGPIDFYGGFAGNEIHEFHRSGSNRTVFSGERGSAMYIDNAANILKVTNYNTQMPVVIDGFQFSGVYAVNTNSACIIDGTSAVVRNCRISGNQQGQNDGSSGSGGAGLQFSDKYNTYWGNYLFVENTQFMHNFGRARGAAVTVRSATKKASFVGCVFYDNGGELQAEASGVWSYAYQMLIKNCIFGGWGSKLPGYKMIQGVGAMNNYKNYNDPYQIIE